MDLHVVYQLLQRLYHIKIIWIFLFYFIEILFFNSSVFQYILTINAIELKLSFINMHYSFFILRDL